MCVKHYICSALMSSDVSRSSITVENTMRARQPAAVIVRDAFISRLCTVVDWFLQLHQSLNPFAPFVSDAAACTSSIFIASDRYQPTL